jgi:hypothetical protein
MPCSRRFPRTRARVRARIAQQVLVEVEVVTAGREFSRLIREVLDGRDGSVS